MTLYEIDRAILELVNSETGEIDDFEALDALQLERDSKVENIALYYKNLVAEAKAIRDEENTLADRRKALESKADHMKDYLAYALGGEKFETARVKCSWRRSKAIEIEDDKFFAWAKGRDDLVTYSAPKANRAAIKAALEKGEEITGAVMVEKNNITVR